MMRFVIRLLLTSFLTTVLFSIAKAEKIEERLKRIEEKMITREEFMLFVKTVNKRFEDMNKRFEDMNKRFEDLHSHMNRIFTVLGLLHGLTIIIISLLDGIYQGE